MENNKEQQYTKSSILSLISRIHAESSSYLKEQLAQEGLEEFVSSHGNIMYHLSNCGSLTMKEIAQKINRDKSTTTVLIKKLCDTGYVYKEPSKTDNRVTYIKLTEAGNQYTQVLDDISKDLIEKCYQNISEEDKDNLLRILLKILDNFCQA